MEDQQRFVLCRGKDVPLLCRQTRIDEGARVTAIVINGAWEFTYWLDTNVLIAFPPSGRLTIRGLRLIWLPRCKKYQGEYNEVISIIQKRITLPGFIQWLLFKADAMQGAWESNTVKIRRAWLAARDAWRGKTHTARFNYSTWGNDDDLTF